MAPLSELLCGRLAPLPAKFVLHPLWTKKQAACVTRSPAHVLPLGWVPVLGPSGPCWTSRQGLVPARRPGSNSEGGAPSQRTNAQTQEGGSP